MLDAVVPGTGSAQWSYPSLTEIMTKQRSWKTVASHREVKGLTSALVAIFKVAATPPKRTLGPFPVLPPPPTEAFLCIS